MHTIKITPNLGLLFEYQCTSGKFIRLPNLIESKKSIRQRESNRIESFFARIGMLYRLSVRERISRTTRTIFTNGRGSVLAFAIRYVFPV